MASILPNAVTHFDDNNGNPLAGGQVFFYIPNTSTLKNTYQDKDQTILNTNPVILDSRGEAIIWGSGTYRQVVKDSDGNLIWDRITEDPNAGLTGNMVDDLFIADGLPNPNGYPTFTPGVTDTLTLSAGAGSISNLWLFFDASYQDDTQIESLDGVTLTLAAPIPVGFGLVTVKIGSTIAIGTPAAGTVTDASVAPNANISSAKLSFLQAGSGAKRRTVQSKFRETASITDFGGAVGDGVFDCTQALADMINSGARAGYIPAGRWLVKDGINLCNLGASGLPFTLYGDGAQYDNGSVTAGTQIVSQPGVGKNIVEVIGSQFVTIRDIFFKSTGTSGASNGLILARSDAGNFAQNNYIQRCIFLLDRANAMAIYNNCSEQLTLDANWFESDRPCIFALANEAAPATQYAAIGNTWFSNTTHIVHDNTFLAHNGPAVWLIGVATSDWSANLLKKVPANTYQYGRLLQSSGAGYAHNFNNTFHDQTESFVNAERWEGQTFGIDLKLSTSEIQGATLSLGGSSVHYNPKINVSLLNTVGTQNVIEADAIGANIFGGEIWIPPNAKLVDTDVGLRGTVVNGGPLDMSQPTVLSVAAGSSFEPLSVASDMWAKVDWTPGNVASPGNSVPKTFAFAGALVGDRVEVTWPYSAQGCTVSGSVDTNGQVTLIIQNITGATVPFLAGTFKVRISRAPNIN